MATHNRPVCVYCCMYADVLLSQMCMQNRCCYQESKAAAETCFMWDQVFSSILASTDTAASSAGEVSVQLDAIRTLVSDPTLQK